MSNLIKNFQNFSHQEELWKKKNKIVLGISGGPDSMCLLDIFSKLAKKYQLAIIIAHVNYNLRNKDSRADEALVKELSQKNNFKIFIHRPKIKSKKNLEEKLRDIRYNFFEKVRKENRFDLIAVAHNADDQVETFFLNLLRGAGKKGLTGMKSKNEKVIRPLLFCFKNEIVAYLKEGGINYRIDKTNKENKFNRNKIRNLLIPYLEKKFNPNIKKTILRTVESFSQKENDSLLSIIRGVKGDLRGITSAHVKEIKKILKSRKSKVQVFNFQGLKIERRGDKLTIDRKTINNK